MPILNLPAPQAMYNAYREAQLPLMKESHPGLRLSQYNDLIFNSWKRAPENPENKARLQQQKAAAGAAEGAAAEGADI